MNMELDFQKTDGFQSAIKYLQIEQYESRIFNSNSRGELFHLMDYISIAERYSKSSCPEFFVLTFKEWFDEIVAFAEKEWENPEHVFQHIPRLLRDTFTSDS